MRAGFIALALLLSGCAQFAAKTLEDANYLHDAARAYVIETHKARQAVRRICWEMLMIEVRRLEADGKPDEARARLKANYPSLVTMSLIKQVKEDPLALSAEPFGCD